MSRWERGFSSPSPYYREKLCLLFGKSAEALGLLSEQEDTNLSSQDPSLSSPLEPAQEITGQRNAAPSGISRLFASLSYALWWLTALPIFLFNRDNPFVLFHCLQCMFFFGSVTILEIIMVVLLTSLSLEAIQFILVLIFTMINIAAVIAWIMGMVKAGMGTYYRLPFVGNLSKKIVTGSEKQSGLQS